MRALYLARDILDALATEAISQGGRLPLRGELSGTSMVPAIRPGDTLLMEASGPEELRPGDIALFRGPHGRLVAHRVVHAPGHVRQDRLRGPGEKTSLLVSSEAPGSRPEDVPPEAVLGRVLVIKRGWPFRPLARRLHSRLRRVISKEPLTQHFLSRLRRAIR